MILQCITACLSRSVLASWVGLMSHIAPLRIAGSTISLLPEHTIFRMVTRVLKLSKPVDYRRLVLAFQTLFMWF